MINVKEQQRKKRHQRTRSKIVGTATVPRVCIYRSTRYTYAQVIDDGSGKVLLGVNDKSIKGKDTKTKKATTLGVELASKLKDAKIAAVCFDRAGYKYHGRVKAVAEALREAGIKL